MKPQTLREKPSILWLHRVERSDITWHANNPRAQAKMTESPKALTLSCSDTTYPSFFTQLTNIQEYWTRCNHYPSIYRQSVIALFLQSHVLEFVIIQHTR